MGYKDSNFPSFINSFVDVDAEAKHSKVYEVLFHNEALLNILEKKEVNDLNEFIKKPLFSQKDLKQHMSLSSIALTDGYQKADLKRAFKIEDVSAGAKQDDSQKDLQIKAVTFQRSKIIFEDRQSIMLNLREVTELQACILAQENMELDKKVNTILSDQLLENHSMIEKGANLIIENYKNVPEHHIVTRTAQVIKNATLIA